MNIFHKVTTETLKKNRTRTIVTIIGIILSTSMICAVTTFAESFFQFLYEREIYSSGEWYGMTESISKDTIDELNEDSRTDILSLLEEIGYAKIDTDNEDKPYLYVASMDESFEENMPVHLTDGRLPETENEIILPEHLSENGGVTYEIGDTLTIDIGDRESEGYPLTQQNSYIASEDGGEAIKNTKTYTYTVVGIYERPDFEPYSAPGYTALTVAGDVEAGSNYTAYFTTKNAKDIYTYMEDHELEGDVNSYLLAYKGSIRYSGLRTVAYGLCGIVIVLIMFGSISLIYNAFSISVSERTKQFGLLASIGATKKQIRRSVFYESFVVSVIGIPIGIVCGIGGIGVTIHLLAERIQSLSDSEIKMHVSVSGWSILVAIIIAFVTVLLSAYIPSKRATRVTALEAIRQSQDFYIGSKDVKISKLTYRLFGLEGMIAKKHFKRSRKRYRTTVLSLFMSIVLFISTSSYCRYLSDAITQTQGGSTYDISYSLDETIDLEQENKLYEELKNVEGVKSSNLVRSFSVYDGISKENCTDYWNSLNQSEDDVVFAYLYFIDDDNYQTLLKDNDLDKDTSSVLYDSFTTFDGNQEKYVTEHVLNITEPEITVTDFNKLEGYYVSEVFDSYVEYVNEETGEIKNVPSEEALNIFTLNTNGTVRIENMSENIPIYEEEPMFIYPASAIETFDFDSDSLYDTFYFSTKNDSSVYDKMKKVMMKYGLESGDLNNQAEREEGERNLVYVINVFAYGFIILISLIAVANVFNTISTNVLLRRREFAMLKSVGMGSKAFNKMMNYECMIYGFRSLVVGIPVSIAVTYLIYKVINDGYTTEFYMPWHSIVIAVFSVFLTVFVTMMYSMSKVKKENPLEALKNENL